MTELPGGNLLRGWFETTRPIGLTVLWQAPIRTTIDFGDSAAAEIPDAGQIVHRYSPGSGPQPWILRALLIDGDGRLRGRLRFEVPRRNVDPIAVQAAPFGTGVR